jgi:UDP-N-acetylmuramoylalanine--D-glutamate ligase
VGDAKFLLECGAELLITDLKTERELASSIEKLKSSQFPASSYRLHLGGHRMEDFSGEGGWKPDFILKGAGVPLGSPFIEEAKNNGIPIEMSTSLFAKLLPKNTKIVGVTGTRGKSTTTMMIYEILKRFKNGEKGDVFLGGNLRDKATLPLLNEIDPSPELENFVVMELDSWQLQGFGDANLPAGGAGISPDVAVFTTFMPDHMNYYGGSMEKYFDDKANIFKYQTADNFLIVGDKVVDLAKKENPKAKMVLARAEDFPSGWNLKILGLHNRLNAVCAILATRALGVPEEMIKKAVENFEPIVGRLQFVREIKGIKIYNDNNSTTPIATVVALESLNSGSRMNDLILIAGGADKGLDLDPMINAVNKYCKKVFLLPGTGTERIKNKELRIEAEESKDLNEAVKNAFDFAEEGDVILFSPGFASFGLFVNEYDRNDQFLKLVSSIS